MPQEQIIARYYPTLDTVVTLDEFPEFLNFLRDGLASLFGKIHYRNLQFSKSPNGDTAFYSLDIVSKKRLDIELPGADIFIVLNPTVDDAGVSAFPITIQYQWPILAYLRSFNLDNFNFSPEAFYDLALQILKIPEGQVVANGINTFTEPNSNTLIEQFVLDINAQYGVSISVPNDPNPMPQLLIEMQSAIGQPPAISIYETYILNNNDTAETKRKLNVFFKSLLPTDNVESYIKELVLPRFSATLELSAAIEFPRWMLVPVDESTLEEIPEVGDTGYPRVNFRFGEALFYAGTEAGINYELDLALTQSQPAQIGKTGLIINVERLKLDLSAQENIPEADADNRPVEFMGVYADEVSVTLPKKWFNNVDNTTVELFGKEFLVGTGGISGLFGIQAVGGGTIPPNSYLTAQIGDWRVGFNKFDLRFKQNIIIESSILGYIEIPKLKDNNNEQAKIDISGHLYENGDFNLTASEPDGIPFTLLNFVKFNFLTLELGRQDDDFYIGTSCQISFLNATMQKLLGDQVIEIPRLRIYDTGRMEIVGGTTSIPTNISLNLGPIEMAVTGIHLGSTQQEYQGDMRKYNYWGFDGAISLDPLGLDVRGEGIKYYYTVDNDEFEGEGNNFIRIQTIEVDLIIPGTADPKTALAIIHGSLTIPDPGESPEYRGSVSVKLPKARMAGGAAMRLQPRYPAFILEAGIEIPTPIPLGATGLGFYGFGGLIGYQYIASKSAIPQLAPEATWYDYFTYPQRGVNIDKFITPAELNEGNPTDAFSIGAGTVLATLFDDGFTFSTRLMAVLSIPSVFILEGRANVLANRLGMLDSTEPPFFAFVAIGDNSLEFGFGADYQLPKSNGWILDLQAEAQAGFFFDNSSAWYLNFGTRDNPVTARVLTLFTAQSYLMLSAQGMEAGARLDFELRKKFGPAKVHIYAYLEVGGFVSFESPQIGGYIAAGGGIDVDIWIIGISLSLEAIFTVEAAKPFLIYAEVDFRACVKVLFVKVCKSFTVKLKWEKNNTVDRSPIPPLPYQTNQTEIDRTEELVTGIHMLTNESFKLDFLGMSNPPTINDISKVIPLDTYIEFKTEKGLVPGAVSGKIGGYTFPPENTTDLVPPEKIVLGGHEIRQVKHKYSIENIEIKAWNGSSWQEYHPYEALVEEVDRPTVANLKVGYWQIKGKQYDTLRLLATTPFTYMDSGEPGWVIPEQYGITPSTLYCQEEIRTPVCSNVLNKDLGIKYYPPTQYNGHFINGAYFTLSNISGYEFIDGNIVLIESEYMEVTNVPNNFSFAKSLSFNNYNSMVIVLPEPSVQVGLKLTTDAEKVTIRYYKSIIDDTTSTLEYELVTEVIKLASELSSEVVYQNEDKAISKIVIEPNDTNIAEILDILEQIAELFEITYDGATGEVTITEPTDTSAYNQLLSELENLMSAVCSGEKPKEKAGNCEQNPVICSLYDQLLQIYNECFVPIQTSQDVDDSIGCIQEFFNLLVQLDAIVIDTSFSDEFSYFTDVFLQIQQLIGHHEQILRFRNLENSAIKLLEIIYNLGNCDCDPKPNKKCQTSLQEVCWLSVENHEWNETIPGSEAIEEEYQLMIEGVTQQLQPIWRPNTHYYIKATLKDIVDNGDSPPGEFDYYYGFKTVGPVGHYHRNPEVDYLPQDAKPEEYPLTSLTSYIDYNRSYPKASGNLLRSKPLFYGNGQCRISIYFTKYFVEHMLNNWYDYNGMPTLEGAIHIAIKDPVTDVIIPYPLPVDYDETVPVSDLSNAWQSDDDPSLPPHIIAINNMIENGELPCEIDLGSPLVPQSSYFTITPVNLKPRKLYTALLYNAFEHTVGNVKSEPIHEYTFQTSRYESFTEQVNSYLIQDEEMVEPIQAVYELNISVSQNELDEAYQIIANSDSQIGDTLETQYMHFYDRVTEGVLGLKPQDPPERTEFHKVINTNTGNIVAIIIRNPEPFNIPRIPIDIARDTIQVTFGNGNVHGSYHVLHNKDYSGAIIMRGSQNITAPRMHFKFKYLAWNGNEYLEEETIFAGDIIINE
ncbi:hypothetical protein [Luteirhabdus pelagi]|uniref:hypothetical protein n=1 Tax=Luteirhabdus pelagi TaxID=2792783 RepID=UPI00193A5776|nr:hypothetical protein [Luteirhabdus pelagi]